MLRHSEQLDQLAKALSAAQGVMEGASKDKTNPHFKSKYADLGSVWEAVRAPLAKNGLSVVQLPFTDADGRVHVSTMLMHQSGQWIEASYFLQPTKNDPQGLGSAITYMKRYALTGMGVAPEDDDGNDASRPHANGNGHTDPLPPLQRPVTADPRLAAIKWANEAEDVVRKFSTSASLRSWEVENGKAMSKLQTVDRNIHGKLLDIINERYTQLNPLNAG